MTTGANAIFLDTNVLVYASVANAPLHTAALQTRENFNATGIDLWVSRQVLREYLATLSRPQTYTNPLPILTLIADIEYFQNKFLVAEDNPQVTQNLLTLVEQVAVAGRQIHDTNIVATMQAHNITKLLTHNLADFNRFAHLITLLPLQE